MRRFTSTLFLLVLITCLVAGPANAKFVAFDRSSSHTPSIKVGGDPERFTVEVNVPGVHVDEKDGYTSLRIENEPLSMKKGYPELPMVTTSVILPDKGMAVVRIIETDEVEVKLSSKIRPSLGHLTRDINLSEVPLIEGDSYKIDGYYPSNDYLVEIDSPYICRDFRGAAIRLSPVRYNPVTNKLFVLKRAVVEVGIVHSAVSINEKQRDEISINSDFAPIYKRIFANYNLIANSKNWTDIDENAGRAIIICPPQWLESMNALQEWRATKGVESKLVSTTDLIPVDPEDPEKGLTTEHIKNYIAEEYAAGGLTWILLVGDTDTMPVLKGENEGAESDLCYIKLEGDDHVGDAFISRFSAKTTDEVDVQVARTIKYEKEPVTGEAAAFYRKATGIASNQGSPTDAVRAGWLRDAELAWNYDIVDEIYDPSANAGMVTEAVNEGRGLINYIGHGSKYQWVSSSFRVSHVEKLTNDDGKWPMIWSVACVNGDFAYGSDCFCEAWAKAGTTESPLGAIGIVGASTNMAWVPPCVWQKAIICDYLVTEEIFTAGGQHHYGMLKCFEEYGYSTGSQGTMLAEQCIYFGDSSVTLRTDIPREAIVEFVPANAERNLTLKVSADGKPVKSARVNVTTELAGASTGVTGEDGIVKLTFESGLQEVETIGVTVTGPNLIPLIQHELELPGTEPEQPEQPEQPE